ncbi:MAG: hypothetical protein R3E53_01495 [Myxococcota bacterium]
MRASPSRERGRLALQAYSISFALREAGLLASCSRRPHLRPLRGDREEVETRVSAASRASPTPPSCVARSCTKQSEGCRRRHERGLAGVVARDMVETGEPLAFVQRLDALAALTPEAVRDVARRTFESAPSTLVIAPTGPMRWLKPVLEWLPDAVGASLERSLL